jgi:N-carbamoyl-L-amino-acid hydrolase
MNNHLASEQIGLQWNANASPKELLVKSDLHINADRLLADLTALTEIGGTPDGGVHRPALSEPDLEARRWLMAQAQAAGLSVREDGIGNVSAILPANTPDAQTVMCGSHLDTVPCGGRFDGALGVAAAFEVLRTVKDSGLQLPCHLEAISFTDEEGTWSGLLGSMGLAGRLSERVFEQPRGGKEAFAERLAAAGLTREGALSARREPGTIKAWVEAHIEQGARLEEAGTPIGVVTGIVGIASYWLTFQGRADHAGTTPMDRRLDAMRGVAEFVRQSRSLVMNRFEGGVANCGIVAIEPGAFNIVPGRARLALEFRHHDVHTLEAMREALLNLALHVAELEGLGLEIEQADYHEPAPMNRGVMVAIEEACDSLGLRHMRLASYAGHDTQVMAGITQAGMFFVPSVGGASHCPREFTHEEDCINAGNVLLHTVLRLAS